MDGRKGDAPLDLLVVGAGPAGLATAIFARLAGYAVAVCDPGEGPQNKACGEGLMACGIAALARLGIDVATLPHAPLSGVRYHDGPACAYAPFAPGATGVGLARTALSAALQARARATGVDERRARLRALRRRTDGVEAELSCGDLVRARYLVGADGLHSTVRRLAGLQAPPPAPTAARPRFGLRRHLACAPYSDAIEIYLGPIGEAYVTPVGPDAVNVAFLTCAPKRSWQAHLADFPALARALGDAAQAPARATEAADATDAATGRAQAPMHRADAGRADGVARRGIDAPRGAGPFVQGVRLRAEGRVALVGDAAGYVDAVTGEGVSLALLGAEAWVQAMAAADPARAYRRALAPAWRHYARHARLLLWLNRRTGLRRWALRALAHLPWAMAWWVRRAVALPRPMSR